MSSHQIVLTAQTLPSSCSHGENFDDKIIDHVLREPDDSAQMLESPEQLEFVHKLPADIAGMILASERSTLLHSVRVSLMSRIGSRIMGLMDWEHDRVELSGLTHDLGKQIPEISQLVMNGRTLDPAERKVVNKHAQYGFEMLYGSRSTAERALRNRLGNFMGHVALDVLFSHSLTKSPSHSGVTEEYLNNLLSSDVITEADVTKHVSKTSVQLVALADVTDALLSTGLERAYRIQRLTTEGRPAQLDPAALPNVVAELIDVPSLDVERIVPQLTRRYNVIEQQAENYVRSLKSRLS